MSRAATCPGLVTLVSRRGEIHVDAIGRLAFDGPPMTRDSIFRITSMTKPVTAAAAMILVEEGKLRLDDPARSMVAGTGQAQGAARDRCADPSDSAGTTRDHAARPADVPLRLRHDSGVSGSLSDPEGDCGSRVCAGARIPVLSVRRIDAALRQPAADLSAGRTLALQRRNRDPRRPDRAAGRCDVRGIPARSHLCAVGNEGYRVPCARRQASSVRDLLCPRSRDTEAEGFRLSGDRQILKPARL